MKTPWCVTLVALCLGTAAGLAQKPGDLRENAELVITERGPHHRVIERMIPEVQPDGRVRERKSSYTELATGLHYLKDGKWEESREEIEIFNGAAVARQGQHQVIFAANLNSSGAIDLLAADGQRFRSHVLGLVYTDYASGKSVMVSEIKDSVGELTAPNQVTYPDAFDGDCLADVRYTYTKGGFEQDIILRTAPPSPAEWGLDPETTRLEVFTEFIEAPEAKVSAVIHTREENELARRAMKEPDLVDQYLDFGALHIGPGQAFPLDGEPSPFSESSVQTGKSWERIEGRLILIEKVDYRSVREHLGRLPKSASLKRERKVGLPDPGRTLQARVLPARPSGEPGQWARKLQASVTAPRAGFVLDYVSLSTSSLTNYTFKADSTYYISGAIDLYGTTVFEGGAVVKYAKTSGTSLNIRGTLDSRTNPFRSVTLTAREDDTIGEIIAGSSGTPTNAAYCSNGMLRFWDTAITNDVQNFQVSYAYLGLFINSSVKTLVRNVTVGKGNYGIGIQNASVVTCRNVLLYDQKVNGFVHSGTTTNHSEHLTVHRVATFRSSTSGYCGLTNSLLISVTNNLVFSGANNVTNLSDAGVFQSVGAASYYLANASTNRDSGTTNLNANLLAALKKKTTYPPIVLTNAITTDTTLSIQATRDSNTPDLGYHYDPLDYAGSGIVISNATFTVQAGVGMGLHGGSASFGLLLLDGGKVNITGTPDSLARVVRYNLVQEQSVTNWSASSMAKSLTTPGTYSTNSSLGGVTLRFVDFSMPAGGSDHLYLGATNLSVNVRDCQFLGGQITSLRPDVTILNNLFERVAFKLYSPVNGFTALMRNSTHFGGSVTVSNNAGGTWTLRDNLYDGNSLFQNGTVGNNWNAYLTNGTRLTPTGANDVVLTVTNVTYETGWLGRFYLPTNLTSHGVIFNAGSQNATNSGLYHYTMVTNQTPELSTVVDIGFHYVAVNSSGMPIDGDGDGLANYLEDTNGNGLVDSGELSWQSADTDGDGVNDYVEFMLGRSGTVAGTTNDVANAVKLQLFTPLK